jgi:hypothetical protein
MRDYASIHMNEFLTLIEPACETLPEGAAERRRNGDQLRCESETSSSKLLTSIC